MLIDADIVLYALSATDVRRDACRTFLAGLGHGDRYGYASTELIQEVVHHRLRISGDRKQAVGEARKLAANLVVLNFDYEVLDLALDLIESDAVRGRNAVHAATALAYGIPTIASTDTAFDSIEGITRIDPTVVPPPAHGTA
ncbi:MAG: type II toxin-antitoxin system VapC family toxin [Leucobacter sp.]